MSSNGNGNIEVLEGDGRVLTARDIKEMKRLYRTQKKHIRRVRKQGGQEAVDALLSARANEEDKTDVELFLEGRKSVRELVASNGVNPNPLDYMEINDNGEKVYTMSMYIDKLPRGARFAQTFSALFNFEDVTSTVFINPLLGGRSSKMLDKRIYVLDSERTSAENQGDRNRYRKLSTKMNTAESWSIEIESGDNSLYEVVFLFNLRERDLDKLQLKVADFHNKAKEVGIELSACFACHPEAYASGMPLNRLLFVKDEKTGGVIHTTTAKKHVMDKKSLACIFNHTRNDFSHKNGIIAGRNMHTGQPFCLDVYNKSSCGYGVVVSGGTGTGKSCMVKNYLSRYSDFGYHIASVDFETRGNRGEYSLMAERLGGVSYTLTSTYKKGMKRNLINMFDINEETEFDETTETEFRVLRLTDKIADLLHIVMTMIIGSKREPEFETATAIENIVQTAIRNLYSQRGIVDGDPDSLYESGNVVSGAALVSGRKKKRMPTITDFYKEVLFLQKRSRNPLHDVAYSLIIDSMQDWVSELYYCPHCLKYYTKEEYDALKEKSLARGYDDAVCECVMEKNPEDKKEVDYIQVVKGSKSYFDGESTIQVDIEVPHINIDISQLPERDRPVAQEIALSFLNENFIKRNSVNPKKIRKMVLLIDECHKLFPNPHMREFLGSCYRTCRKRYVSPWVVTQALADFDGFDETETILKNSATIMILKQDYQDRDFLLEKTVLTPSQVEEVLSLGGDPNDDGELLDDSRKGEVCLINNNRVVFVKADYLKTSEQYISETSMDKIAEMHNRKSA